MVEKIRAIPYCQHHAPEYESQAVLGPALTILNDRNDILAVGGIMIPWQGMGVAWFKMYPKASESLKAFWWVVVEGFSGWIRDYKFLRVEAHVDSSDPRAIRTAQHLGFVRESTLRRWGPGGRDHEMMVILL